MISLSGHPWVHPLHPEQLDALVAEHRDDFEPLPQAVAAAGSGSIAHPRFARNVRELLEHTTEDCHEPH